MTRILDADPACPAKPEFPAVPVAPYPEARILTDIPSVRCALALAADIVQDSSGIRVPGRFRQGVIDNAVRVLAQAAAASHTQIPSIRLHT